MSKANDTSRELTSNELDAVSGGAKADCVLPLFGGRLVPAVMVGPRLPRLLGLGTLA